MKLITIERGRVVLELDATDCLSLADACGHALYNDVAGDHSLIEAHQTALRLGAVVAAFDTAKDAQTPDTELLAHVREVWGPVDSSVSVCGRAPEPQ